MDEPAAKVEFSKYGEELTFDVYENGIVEYWEPEEISGLERVRRVLGTSWQDPETYAMNDMVDDWIDTWAETVESIDSYGSESYGLLTVSVHPDHHEKDDWEDASWDQFSIDSVHWRTPSADALGAVRELVDETRYTGIWRYMTENPHSTVTSLVDDVLHLEPEDIREETSSLSSKTPETV